MFIGHLPAGYLTTRGILKLTRVDAHTTAYRRLMWFGLFVALAPDLDLVYFYLIDNRQTLHHHYFTHFPYFWACISLLGMLVAFMTNTRAAFIATLILFTNALLHMLLDTIVGKIMWGWPFSFQEIVLFEVPAMYDWWVWNFVLHWTFLLECLVVLTAIRLYRINTVRAQPGPILIPESYHLK